MASEIVLITGGARSGKSAFAERLAKSGARVLFVATAEPLDEDMERRIAAHRRSRPQSWRTLEEPLNLPDAIAAELAAAEPPYDTVLVDCLTIWTSNILLHHAVDGEDSLALANAERAAIAAAQELLDACALSSPRWLIVTNEVGLGVVPPSTLGRAYRDTLGRINALVASHADKVYLLTAGIPIDLKALQSETYV